MRASAFALLALFAAQAEAQTYKCIDAQKRITYSNIACEKQGLNDAGPVADRLMTVPATETRRPAARQEPARAPQRPTADDAEVDSGSARIKPVVPLMEKLAK